MKNSFKTPIRYGDTPWYIGVFINSGNSVGPTVSGDVWAKSTVERHVWDSIWDCVFVPVEVAGPVSFKFLVRNELKLSKRG